MDLWQTLYKEISLSIAKHSKEN